jgi:hypothetical protein
MERYLETEETFRGITRTPHVARQGRYYRNAYFIKSFAIHSYLRYTASVWVFYFLAFSPMRIDEDIKLDYSDVLLRPKRSTLTSRKDVDLEREFRFYHSPKVWR